MRWDQQLQALRWRAAEDADTKAELLPKSQREDATRFATETTGDFPSNRAEWLRLHAALPGSTLHELLEALRLRELGVISLIGFIVAFVAGYALTELGREHLINVVALPFFGLLLWNAAIIVVSLITEWRASSSQHGLPAWLVGWLLPAQPAGDSIEAKVARRFAMLATPCFAQRVSSRARAWLHLAAAVLALGTITGMYAKGWSHEYRAVWESTLLDQPTATRVLTSLYKPASQVFGLPVPVEQLATMRAGPGREPQPADALPWIHLFAGTLLLLVLLPRLALVALTLWRGNQRVEQSWSRMDWAAQEVRQRSTVSGTGLEIDVLSCGWRNGEEPRDRWTTALRERFGALALLQFHHCPDDCDEFVKAWTPGAANVVVVFNAATTPEQEVQATLMSDLRAHLTRQTNTLHVTVLLDAATLRDRRSPEAVETRIALWKTMLRGAADEFIVA